jgi:hypothetical protein
VLAHDDDALAAIAPEAAPIYLLVERLPSGIAVTRLDEAEWRFAKALCDGAPLEAALAGAGGLDAPALLAGHLAAGRLVGFTLARIEDAATVGAAGGMAR